MKTLFNCTQNVEKHIKDLLEMVKITQESQVKGELQVKDLTDLV